MVLTALIGIRTAHAETAPTSTFAKLFALSDTELDLATAKVTIDRVIDPSIDASATFRHLSEIVSAVNARLPNNATSRQKVEALRRHLYEAGAWNGDRPFSYDLDDPLGRNTRNKLLSTYLATRRGNCVSMPLLFIVLGQKLGIDVTAALAPDHVFVKYRDESGTWFNLETTSGAGFTSDAWIMKQMPMTVEAIANGIYMRPLSKRETLAVMLGTLMESYGHRGLQQQRVELATFTLHYVPNDLSSMLHLQAAYLQMMRQEFSIKYGIPSAVPDTERQRLRELNASVNFWRRKAESVGWREPDAASKANYQQSVNLAKSAQGKGAGN